MIPFSRILVEGIEKGFYCKGRQCIMESFNNRLLFYICKSSRKSFSIGLVYKGAL
jgi:hypothetical protein